MVWIIIWPLEWFAVHLEEENVARNICQEISTNLENFSLKEYSVFIKAHKSLLIARRNQAEASVQLINFSTVSC